MVKINIIGSNFSSLSSACYTAKAGHDIRVFEKNESIGGRAISFSENGLLFDIVFYNGQLTVPGPGVPPAIISGKIATDEIADYLREQSLTT